MTFRVLPWLIVAFLMSLWIRHTHMIDWEETLDGTPEQIVAIFTDVEAYPDGALAGRVKEARFVSREREDYPDGGHLKIDHFALTTALGTNYGKRVYRHSADGRTIKMNIYFDSPLFFEFSTVRWLLQQEGDQTRVTVTGNRRAPWFFSWYSSFHSEQSRALIRKISQRVAGGESANNE